MLINLHRKDTTQLAARNSSELDAMVNDLMIRYEIKVSTYELDILKYEAFTDIIDSLDCLPDIALCAVGFREQKDDEKSLLNSSLVMRTNYEGPSIFLGDKSFEGEYSIIGISSVAGNRGRESNYIYGSAESGLTTFYLG